MHSQDALGPPVDPLLPQLRGALEACGHEATLLTVDDAVEPVVKELRETAADFVFNVTESFGGKSSLESNVAALMNLLGLRYTGSSPAGLLLAGDKTLTKKVLSFHGIRTPEFATVFRGAVDWAGDISFPVIVKPPQEDASLGISSNSVVTDLKELFNRIDALQSEFQQPVLVEQFIDGREFAGTRSVLANDLEPERVSEIQRVAVEAFHALRLRDYARIDLRMTEAGEVFVIEVNPNCYLERASEFATAAAADGLSYESLIGRILDLALARYSH